MSLAAAVRTEPSERHVRGVLGSGERAVTLVDSYRPVLVWNGEHPVPIYAFPAADVRTDLLEPRAEPGTAFGSAGADRWFDVVIGGERREALAWAWTGGPLDGLIGIDWFRRSTPGVERWFEEDEEVFTHPRDPHKRVDPLPSSRHVVVRLDGQVLADSHRPVALFETGLPTRWYLPPEDVRLDLLAVAPHTTRCPYKGVADALTLGPDGPEIAWRYRDPIPAAAPIRDRVSFYNERVDIEVDGVVAGRPQTLFS
jgi:uncharacterized protein (DUF427 family)